MTISFAPPLSPSSSSKLGQASITPLLNIMTNFNNNDPWSITNNMTRPYPLDSGGMGLVRELEIVRDDGIRSGGGEGLGFTLRRCYQVPSAPSPDRSKALDNYGTDSSPSTEIQTSPKPDCIFVKNVKDRSLADRANLLVGDIILSINDSDVTQCTYDQVIAKIQSSGPVLRMTVLTSERCWPFIRQPIPIMHTNYSGFQGGEEDKTKAPLKFVQTRTLPLPILSTVVTTYMPLLNAYPCYKARLTTYQPTPKNPSSTQNYYGTRPFPANREHTNQGIGPFVEDEPGVGAKFYHPDLIMERTNDLLLKSLTSFPQKVDAKLLNTTIRDLPMEPGHLNSRQFWLTRLEREEHSPAPEQNSLDESQATPGLSVEDENSLHYYGSNAKRRRAIDAAKRAFLSKVSKATAIRPSTKMESETNQNTNKVILRSNGIVSQQSNIIAAPGSRRVSYILATSGGDGTSVSQNLLSLSHQDSTFSTPKPQTQYSDAAPFRSTSQSFNYFPGQIGYRISAKKPYSRCLRERLKRSETNAVVDTQNYDKLLSAAPAKTNATGSGRVDPFLARFPEGINDEWSTAKLLDNLNLTRCGAMYQPQQGRNKKFRETASYEAYDYDFTHGPVPAYVAGEEASCPSGFVPTPYHPLFQDRLRSDDPSRQYSYSKTKSKSQMTLSPQHMLKSPSSNDDFSGSLKRFASTNLKQLSPVLTRDANIPSTTFLTASNKNIFDAPPHRKIISSSANGSLVEAGTSRQNIKTFAGTLRSPEKNVGAGGKKSNSLQNLNILDGESSSHSAGGGATMDHRAQKNSAWKSSKMVKNLKERFTSMLPHHRAPNDPTLLPPSANQWTHGADKLTTRSKGNKQHQKLFANIADHFAGDAWTFAGAASSQSSNGQSQHFPMSQQQPCNTLPNKIHSDSATFDHLLEEAWPSEIHAFVPAIVEKCVELIETYGLYNVGIYRIPGHSGAVSALVREFDKDSGGSNVWSDQKKWRDVNVLASILKTYFRRLADPLFTNDFYQTLIEANRLAVPEERFITLKKFIRMLPENHYHTLKFLMAHLYNIASKSAINRMDSKNLAIVFGPTLVRKSNNDVASMVKYMPDQCKIVESLIVKYKWFFEEGINSPYVPDSSDIDMSKEKCDSDDLQIIKLTPMNEVNNACYESTRKEFLTPKHPIYAHDKRAGCYDGVYNCTYPNSPSLVDDVGSYPFFRNVNCGTKSNNPATFDLPVKQLITRDRPPQYYYSQNEIPNDNQTICSSSLPIHPMPNKYGNIGEKTLGSDDNVLSCYENDSGFGTLASAGEYVNPSSLRSIPTINLPYILKASRNQAAQLTKSPAQNKYTAAACESGNCIDTTKTCEFIKENPRNFCPYRKSIKDIKPHSLHPSGARGFNNGKGSGARQTTMLTAQTCDSGNHSGSSSREGDVSEMDTTPNLGKIRKDYHYGYNNIAVDKLDKKTAKCAEYYISNTSSISSKLPLPKFSNEDFHIKDKAVFLKCKPTSASYKLSGSSKAKSSKQHQHLPCLRRNSLILYRPDSPKSSSSPDFSHQKQSSYSKSGRKRILRRHTVIGSAGTGHMPLPSLNGFNSSRFNSKKFKAPTASKPIIVKSETFCEGSHEKGKVSGAKNVDPHSNLTYRSTSHIPLSVKSLHSAATPSTATTSRSHKPKYLVFGVANNFETLLRSNKYMESAV